jgi:hypothetical protein
MHRTRRIGLGVQRQRRCVRRAAVTVGAARVFFLQVRAVGEQHGAQITRRRVGEDGAAKAMFDEHRQPAAVIKMRVAEHDRVNAAHVDRQGLPIALAVQLQALEHAAVEQQAAAADFDQVLGTGDTVGSAETGELHAVSLPGHEAIDTERRIICCLNTPRSIAGANR